jgi:acetylornithine deacetylase/succinyl-diaminopimelate desuccinylase-like protein
MVPGEDPMKVTEQIQRVLHKLQEEDNSLKATTKIISIEDPVEISQDEQIVRVLNEGIKALFSVEAKIGGMIGANDSRFFIKRGIPTVICGPGITTQSHQIDEYVETRSVFNAAKAYALTMIRFCQ